MILNWGKYECGSMYARTQTRDYRIMLSRGSLHAQWLNLGGLCRVNGHTYSTYKHTIGEPKTLEEGIKMCQDYEDDGETIEMIIVDYTENGREEKIVRG